MNDSDEDSSSQLSLAQLQRLDQRYVLPTYARLPLAVSSGEGSWLTQPDGRKILDLTCGLGVTSLGHAHPAVTAAIVEQASTLLHVSNLMHTEASITLAKRLSESSLGGAVFFCNSGAEANEAAIKLARRHRPRGEIVSVFSGFHGRTYGSLSATPQEAKQEPFAPLVSGFRAMPAAVEAVEASIDGNTSAVLLEAIQGESGVNLLSDEFLQSVRTRCSEVGALMIVDEVQTGMFRTGTQWRYQACGIVPDAITVAKALANGLPIGALITGQHLVETLKPGDHGSTFAGGPLQCAAAHAVLDVMEAEGFADRVKDAGARLMGQLSALPGITNLRGAGLMIAFELGEDGQKAVGTAPELVKTLLENPGIWVNATDEKTVRLLPPLTISDQQIDFAVSAFQTVLSRSSVNNGTNQ